MATMNPDEVRAYLARWQLVRDIEVAELRRTSLETKLSQLEALVASRDLLGAEPSREAEERVGRTRWARLRRALGA